MVLNQIYQSKARKKLSILIVSVIIHIIYVIFSKVNSNQDLLILLSFSVYVPVIVASFYWGLRGGIVTAVSLVLLNLIMDFVEDPSVFPVKQSVFPNNILLAYYTITLFVGIVSGYIFELNNKLSRTLNEKELLLKEIHHRVKNNISLIISLIRLEAGPNSKDKRIDNIEKRIRSIGLIHEKLYQSHDIDNIEIKDYIDSLVQSIKDTLTEERERIQFVLELEKIYLNADIAIPLGLMITEIITNALKYGFPDAKAGYVKIAFRALEDQYFLEISNNGIPISKDVQIMHSKSLGLKLITALTRQLQGTVQLNGSEITRYTITFKK